MRLLEALQILYRGQSNVAVMAERLDMPLKTLQEEFRHYVKVNHIDSDVWKLDIEMSWPYIT
tara:strand:+ start:182 stop:367 length:186 start_codon:yes stop_codon:yes gene_type:complete